MRAITLLAVLVAMAGAVAVSARHHRHSAPAAESSPPPVPSAQPLPSAPGADWHRSIYKGVERVPNDAPAQIRLAFVPRGMSVSWAMGSQQRPMQVVAYGSSPSSLPYTVTATEESTYGTLWFYTAVLADLMPASTYYYSIDGSPVMSFTAPRPAGDSSEFSIIIVGDMGLHNSDNTIAQMNAELNATDFYHHIGDLSYADDYYLRANNTYEGSWDAWQDEMQSITSTKAYMSLPGNHEVTCTEVTPFLCPSYQRNFTAYRNRFRMPWRETGGVQNLWYSYDYGLVHFIQINTETDYPNSKMGPGTYYNAGPFGDQLSWLEADLQKAIQARENGVTPWIIVSGHRPWYSSHSSCKPCLEAFEALLLKYQVDVYFSGHVHYYERMWPLQADGIVTQKDYVNPKGIVYIVDGAAGNVEGLNPDQAPADYSAFMDGHDFGYGRLTVANGSALHWQYFRSTDAALLDDIWVYQSH